MTELDSADYDILLEALQFWGEHTEIGSGFGQYMKTIMTSNSEEQCTAKLDQLKASMDDQKRQKQEQSILLQAKLIQMRSEYKRKEDRCASD